MDRVPVWAPLPPVADFGVRLEGPKAHRTAPNSPWPKTDPRKCAPDPGGSGSRTERPGAGACASFWTPACASLRPGIGRETVRSPQLAQGLRDGVGHLHADEHAGEVCVRARDLRDDRRVGDVDVAGPVYTASRVHYRLGIRRPPHLTRPHRVRLGVDSAPDKYLKVGRPFDAWTGIHLDGDGGGQRFERGEMSGQE